MLKGLRWPLLALVLAGGLLGLALATQPEKQSTPRATPESATSPVTLSAPTTPSSQVETAVQPTPLPVSGPPENILVEALIGQIHKLNPLLAAYNPVDQDITSLIFEGLTTTNDYGEIVPNLAESWTISTDGLEYIVILRNDILWQDGTPFTAEDVVFTIDLISDPQFPGAASLHEFWRTVEVDALSEQMVRFRLTQPLASFTDQLRIGIVPAHVLKGIDVAELGQHPFNLAPIGTGPYQIEALTASGGQIDGIQLRVAPVYRQRPEGADGFLLDRIVFRTYPTVEDAFNAYRRGEVNSISSIPPDQQTTAQQLPGISLYTAIEPRVGVLIYNWERVSIRFVRNARVRLALAYAIDRKGLVAQYLSGRAVAADSPLLPNSWAYEPGTAWPAYDLARAQSLLATANLTFDQASSEATPEAEAATEPPPEATQEAAPPPMQLTLTILVPNDPALVALANAAASGWQQLGFQVSVEAVDATTLQTRLETGDFDVALVELSFEPNADPDPYVFWDQGQYGVGQNYGGMDDRRISETLEMARRDAYGLNRLIYYRRFQELFAERVPALVLYYPLYFYAADARLQGVQLGFLSSHSDRFRHLHDWTFSR